MAEFVEELETQAKIQASEEEQGMTQRGEGDVTGIGALAEDLKLQVVVPYLLRFRAFEEEPHKKNKSFLDMAEYLQQGYTIGETIILPVESDEEPEGPLMSLLVYLIPPGGVAPTVFSFKGKEIPPAMLEKFRQEMKRELEGKAALRELAEAERPTQVVEVEPDPETNEVVELMAQHLSSNDEGVRAAAYQGLMSLGDAAIAALPKVKGILEEGVDIEQEGGTQKLAQALTLVGHLLNLKKLKNQLPHHDRTRMQAREPLGYGQQVTEYAGG